MPAGCARCVLRHVGVEAADGRRRARHPHRLAGVPRRRRSTAVTAAMRGRVVFDGRNVLVPRDAEALGFAYLGVGRCRDRPAPAPGERPMKVLVAGGAGFVGGHLPAPHRRRPRGRLRGQPGRRAALDNIEDLLGRPGFTFIETDVALDAARRSRRSTSSCTWRHRPARSTSTACRSRRWQSNSVGTWRPACDRAEAGRRGSSTSRPRRPTAIRSSIPSPRRTGATSTRSDHGRATTRQAIRRGAGDGVASRPRACGRRSSACSTPTGRRCAWTTAGSSRAHLDAALEGRPLTVHGDGSQTRSFMYVSDLVEGLMCVALDVDLDGQVLNIGNPTRSPSPSSRRGSSPRRARSADRAHARRGTATRSAAARTSRG